MNLRASAIIFLGIGLGGSGLAGKGFLSIRKAITSKMSTSQTASKPVTRAQKTGLCLLLFLFIAFGGIVELRSAFQHTRKTDLGVYLRAAWAVRTGNDPYTITDDRGWHYAYPPLFAILMVPLADPPHDESRAGYVPYEVSVGLWYALTLAIGLAGIHILAKALEESPADPPVRAQTLFSRRWWALRTLPVLILLPAIGASQGRGQVGFLIAFLFCCAAASLLRGRRFRAGMWLSMAICIKMIPAFLLLLPAWRRDWRMLSGSFIGLLFGLIVIPFTVMGPHKALDANRAFYREVILAGVSSNAQSTRGGELTGITSTDNSSPRAVIHNIIYPARATRPKDTDPWVRAVHWMVGFVLTALTLYAAGWKSSGLWRSGSIEAAPREILFLGILVLIMLILSPIFHSHYVSMIVPLVTVLLSILWEKNQTIPSGWKALFLVLFASQVIAAFDSGIFLLLRYFGAVLLSILLLWAASVLLLRRASGYTEADYVK